MEEETPVTPPASEQEEERQLQNVDAEIQFIRQQVRELDKRVGWLERGIQVWARQYHVEGLTSREQR